MLVFLLTINIVLFPIQFSQSNPLPVILYEAKFEDIDKWDSILTTSGSSLTDDNTTLNQSFGTTGKLVGRAIYYYDFTKWTADGNPISFKNSRYVRFGWQFANISSNYIGIMLNYSDTQVYCISEFAGDYSNSSSKYWFLYNDTLVDSYHEHDLKLDIFGDQLYGVAIINSGFDDGIILEPCDQITNFASISIEHIGDGYSPHISIPITSVIMGIIVIGLTTKMIVKKKAKEKN